MEKINQRFIVKFLSLNIDKYTYFYVFFFIILQSYIASLHDIDDILTHYYVEPKYDVAIDIVIRIAWKFDCVASK